MKTKKVVMGVILIIFGILILLQNLGIITTSYNLWSILLSIVVIFIGIKFLKKKGHMDWKGEHKEEQ